MNVNGNSLGKTFLEYRMEEFQKMAAQLYQAAGAYDMPERVLDVLSDMSQCSPLRHENILPVMPPDVEWTDEDQRSALLEGWCIAETSGSSKGDRIEIERDDDLGIFKDDEEALKHVMDTALINLSPLHMKALKYVIQEAEQRSTT